MTKRSTILRFFDYLSADKSKVIVFFESYELESYELLTKIEEILERFGYKQELKKEENTKLEERVQEDSAINVSVKDMPRICYIVSSRFMSGLTSDLQRLVAENPDSKIVLSEYDYTPFNNKGQPIKNYLFQH